MPPWLLGEEQSSPFQCGCAGQLYFIVTAVPATQHITPVSHCSHPENTYTASPQEYDSLRHRMKDLTPISTRLPIFSQEPGIHLQFVTAAVKTNRLEEAERICRDSSIYDVAKVKPTKTRNDKLHSKFCCITIAALFLVWRACGGDACPSTV